MLAISKQAATSAVETYAAANPAPEPVVLEAKEAASVQQTADEKKASAKEAFEKKNNKTWPFGNQDKAKEWDLSDDKINDSGVRSLPSDQVVLVYPKYNTDSEGNKLSFDKAKSRIDVRLLADHVRDKTTDKAGATVYSRLDMEVIELHVPEAQPAE